MSWLCYRDGDSWQRGGKKQRVRKSHSELWEQHEPKTSTRFNLKKESADKSGAAGLNEKDLWGGRALLQPACP